MQYKSLECHKDHSLECNKKCLGWHHDNLYWPDRDHDTEDSDTEAGVSPPPCKRPAADLEAEDAEGEERMEAGDSVVHNTLPGTNIKITTRGDVIAFIIYYCPLLALFRILYLKPWWM